MISLTVLNPTVKKGNIFHAHKVIFPLLCSLFHHTHTHSRTPTQTDTPPPSSKPPLPLPLFHVIKVSARPCWPQATCLFIRGKRRESCQIPLLHIIIHSLCQNSVSHSSFLTAHIVSPLSLMPSLPPFSFLSPTLYFYSLALCSMEQREEVPLTLVARIIYIPAVLCYF